MKIAYDKATDSLYVHLTDNASVKSDEVTDGVVLDFNANGALVGIDVQQASQRITNNSLKGLGMNTSPKAVRFDDDTLWVSLSDGRTIAAPLAWFPRLLEATPAQRAEVEMSRNGLHWDALNEDISVAGLLAGQPDLSRRGAQLAA